MGEERFIEFEPPEVAEARDRERRKFAQPGARIPLLWDDGVTTLEVVDVQPDGTIEVRRADD